MSATESAVAGTGALQQYRDALEAETATTTRLLKAYPESASELKPNAVLKNARELAFIFPVEMSVVTAVLRNEFSLPPQFPPTPATFGEVVAAFESSVGALKAQLDETQEETLFETVQFATGPGQIAEIPKLKVMWLMLCDQIHHRGQFSVYMRMAGAKVPSVYGPTADEPWF